MGNLSGRIVLVTGGSRGIGLAIARACGNEGAEVIITARDRKALATAAKKTPGIALALAADLTRPAGVEKIFSKVKARFKRLDVLINCAGVFTFKPFAKTTLADWQKNIDTNLTGLFLICKAGLPLLERGRSPQIVNILSSASLHGFPKCAAYSASKFGALGLTRVLGEELRAKKIRVTAMIPGPTDTRMVDEFDFPFDRNDLMQPQDIATAVVGALTQPARTSTEQIVLMPSKGRL